MIVSIIAAVSENRVIGKDGGVPWRLPIDLQLFKQITMGHHLIMGRKTFESIGKSLPGRKIIVLSHQTGYKVEGCWVTDSLAEALEIAKSAVEDEVFIGGGAAVYALALPLADRMYLSEVHAEVDGDTFFPTYEPEDWCEELSHHYPRREGQDFDFTFKILVPRKAKNTKC
jgi:dihydrofolate reductase